MLEGHGVPSWVLPALVTVGALDLLGAFVLTGCIHRWFPAKLLHPNQPMYSQDVKLDFFVHMAGIPLVYLYEIMVPPWEAYIGAHLSWLNSLRATLGGLPLYSQFVVYFMLNEFFSYWRHRGAHWGQFWRFHLVHHAAETMHPTNALRFHPGEVILNSLKILGMVAIFRPNPLVISLVLYIVAVHAVLAHANVKWTFGPLKYVFASPIYHRWHHQRGIGKAVNFAETLVVFDMLFGTYYQPTDRLPLRTGVPEIVPTTIFGILVYPFRREAGKGTEAKMDLEAKPPNAEPRSSRLAGF